MSDDFASAGDLGAWVEQGVHEPTFEERLAARERQARLEELQRRLDAELEDERDALARDERLRRRNRRIVATGWLVVFALIAGLAARSLSRSEDRAAAAAWVSAGDADIGDRVWSGRRPSPSTGSGEPLGRPMAAPNGRGPFEFVALQPGSDRPVAYDPCRPIHYVVNGEARPEGADGIVENAIDRISEVTGLQFVADGSTDETAADGRDPFQPDRYGDVWAPVLIWWASPDESALLGGAVAGYGGSASFTVTDPSATGPSARSTSVYVTGQVVLDGPQILDIIRRDPDSTAAAEAVVLHELAHVVGLGHVDDPSQLMNPVSRSGLHDFAAGDLRGLRELGSGACVPGI